MTIVERIRASLGNDAIVEPERRRDTWIRQIAAERAGSELPAPLAVVAPASTGEVAECLRLCNEAGTPVVPLGGGSGVVGGVRSSADAILLSTERLVGLVELNETDLTAHFLAGTNGMEAEQRVQQAGLTTGHWPQSIVLSTVGGWVATRASGQFSTAYGNIEDLVFSLTGVLADGTIVHTPRTPRASAGPDLRHIFLGNEGALGVVTEVTFSLRPLPELQRSQTFLFDAFEDGLEAIRHVVRSGFRPPVVRLYDGTEADRNFGDVSPDNRAILLLVHEGPGALVDPEVSAVASICASHGGAAHGDDASESWLGHRSDPPSAEPYLDAGMIVDTIEIAAPWSTVDALYHDTVRALQAVDGVLMASAHSSHSYRSGTNLYITFAAKPNDGDLTATYDRCWAAVMEATIALGAGISHHHGIGRVRQPWMRAELGDGGTDLLRRLKTALDPNHILNPGVLIPDA